MTLDSPQPESATPRMSFFARLIGIYIHPRRTFEDIVRKPDYFLPLLTVTLMNLLVLWAAIARVGVRRIHELSVSGGDPNYYFLDGSPLDGFEIMFVLFTTHFQTIGGPILLIVFLVFGTIAIQDLIYQRRLRIRPVLAVASYAYLVKLSGSLLGLVIVCLGSMAGFSPMLISPTSVGYFTNAKETFKLLIPMFGFLDILTLWFLILFGVGLSQIAGGKAQAACTVGIWTCCVLAYFFLTLTGFHLFGWFAG